MTHILEAPVHWWHCPACGMRDRTQQANPHTRFHQCAAVRGASLPMIEVGSSDGQADGRQRLVMVEDYVGAGDPLASVRTERGDGSNDVTVFAPTAGVQGEART